MATLPKRLPAPVSQMAKPIGGGGVGSVLQQMQKPIPPRPTPQVQPKPQVPPKPIPPRPTPQVQPRPQIQPSPKVLPRPQLPQVASNPNMTQLNSNSQIQQLMKMLQGGNMNPSQLSKLLGNPQVQQPSNPPFIPGVTGDYGPSSPFGGGNTGGSNTSSGFDSYGFDKDMVDYLNNQQRMSALDAGISYSYDPTTQTFKGYTMAGPVTKTLAEMQSDAKNYGSRPVFGGGPSDGPYMPRPIGGDSSVGTFGYPAGGGNVQQIASTATAPGNMGGNTNSYGGLGGPAVLPTQGGSSGGFGSPQSPYATGAMAAVMGGNMATPYNSGSPIGGSDSTQPFGQTMGQLGMNSGGLSSPQNNMVPGNGLNNTSSSMQNLGLGIGSLFGGGT